MLAPDSLVALRHGGWLPFYDERVDPIHALSMEHALAFGLFEVVAWGMTLCFAAADVVTTAHGLAHPMLSEAVPSSQWVLARFGWPGLAVGHAIVMVLLAVLWQSLPRPYRVVVPLEGAWAGYLITHNNIVALLVVGTTL